jgi:SDR family mycofactocin-dependent oxidoreductase
MGNRVEGKVAFITGAGRGQGRSHAVRLAQEGAHVIATDICRPIGSVNYPLSSAEDLAETERLVKEAGGQVVARQADVRDRAQLERALADGLEAFGRLDVVCANAGILPMALGDPQPLDFIDATDVDLLGAMNTVAVAVAHLRAFGSVILTGSTAALMPGTTDNPVAGPGGAGYMWAKRTLAEYMKQVALHLAPSFIRVNCVHPTNVNTRLCHNEGIYRVFRPDLENPTREDAETAFTHFQAMPIPYVEPADVSNIVVFLAADESRYVTGQQICVDAGALLKFPDGPR